jgi:hypothetical protein
MYKNQSTKQTAIAQITQYKIRILHDEAKEHSVLTLSSINLFLMCCRRPVQINFENIGFQLTTALFESGFYTRVKRLPLKNTLVKVLVEPSNRITSTMGPAEQNVVSSADWTGKGLYNNHLNHLFCLSPLDAMDTFIFSSMLYMYRKIKMYFTAKANNIEHYSKKIQV